MYIAINPIPTVVITPATMPRVAKALGMERAPSAMASTMRTTVNRFQPRRLKCAVPCASSVSVSPRMSSLVFGDGDFEECEEGVGALRADMVLGWEMEGNIRRRARGFGF